VTSHRAPGDNRRLSPITLVNFLLVALAVLSLGIALLARAVPLTGRMTYVVAGPSMAPALPMGSAIVVEPVDPATLVVGDVVSVGNGPATAIFTHRIIRIALREDSLWLETKGDANGSADPSIVPATNVLGRVAMVVPYAGYLVALSSQPSGMVLIIAVGLLLLIAAWLLDPKRSMDLAGQPA
jgi:signal peptidase I